MNIVRKDSPNFGNRPQGVKPSLIIIHGTAGLSTEGDLSWLCSSKSQVSYHFLIGEDGTVYQLVDEVKRAWHAGVSEWEGRSDCNDFSIGVAFSNDGKEPYTAKQYQSGRQLVNELRRRWSIPASGVVGHCHVSPKRKTDPWLHFHWSRLFD